MNKPLDVIGKTEPKSWIGERVRQAGLGRHLQGRGRFIADLSMPRMLHLCFVRSPHAHARIVSIRTDAALAAPGVKRVVVGAELAAICVPFVGTAKHRQGHKSAPQHPMAVDRAVWAGQPVVAVVAESRAQAEDAAELVEIEWEPLPAVVYAAQALDPATPPIHPELGDNLAFEHRVEAGEVDRAFAAAAVVVSQRLRFERQTGVPLEPRGMIADYDPGDGSLTVHHSHQAPFQMQVLFSMHLGIPEHKVRVIAPDVGGGFGVKLNVYGEELAVAAISKIMRVPVKYLADRLESFLADGHAREHDIEARIAVSAAGRILAMELDDLAAIGAYGMPLRFNIAEGLMAVRCTGAQYDFPSYRGRTRSAYVNKNLVGMYRGVGMPLACAATELLVDLAAKKLAIDPVEFRRRNYRRPESLPCVSPGGSMLRAVSFRQCLDKLVANMDYERLRAEQAELRKRGIYRGIGIAAFVEETAYGPSYYGPSEAPVSVQDGCTLRLEPSGMVRCLTSNTDQGQGTLTALSQIVATGLGIEPGDVDVRGNDTGISPFGGGAWGSRGLAIGGEAALKAARMLKANVLAVAAAITKVEPEHLDLAQRQVIDRRSGLALISLADVARVGYFRQDLLPAEVDVQLSVSCNHVDNQQSYYMANGVQGCHLQLDAETGFISVLAQWAVDDCGRIVNPKLVDEQIRGGVVQGIGAALYEECLYGEDGSLLNGTLADYLVPMAAEMPDIHVDHVETPETGTLLGAKGVGEAGLIGAVGAVWVAVNDALHPLDAVITHQPFTPERVLTAIRRSATKNR